MKIDLISFTDRVARKKKVECLIKIVNESDSDLLLFPGWSVEDPKFLELIKSKIKNLKSLVIFEVNKPLLKNGQENQIFLLKKGKIIDTGGHQIFVVTQDVSKDKTLIQKFIDHTKAKKITKFKGKNILHLQCGEVNILRNLRSKNNQIIFRSNTKEEASALIEIHKAADIIVNPIHTCMSNQGNLKEKRRFYSNNKKVYCFTGNLEVEKEQKMIKDKLLRSKMVQGCFYDGNELRGDVIKNTNELIVKRYSTK